MQSNLTDDLNAELKSIYHEGVTVSGSTTFAPYAAENSGFVYAESIATPIWNKLSQQQLSQSSAIRGKVAAFGVRLLAAVKSAPLMEQADEVEIRTSLRQMSSALRLKSYSYHAPYAVQRKTECSEWTSRTRGTDYSPPHSRKIFKDYAISLRERIQLIAPAPHELAQAIVSTQTPSIQKYRPNTAFIMMQIDEKQPKLEDVKNCIKEVFKEFGIDAIRSDELSTQT